MTWNTHVRPRATETFTEECERLMQEPRNEREAYQALLAPELRRMVTTRRGIVIGSAHTRRRTGDSHAFHGPYRARRRWVREVLGVVMVAMVVLPLLWALAPAVRHAVGVMA